MAEAWQQPHLTSHEPAEVGTDFKLTPYDELAASRNGKQRCRFVDEYMITLVASEAVTAAGYKTRHPRQKGWELMRIPLVAAAIAQKMQERIERTEVTQDRVVEELARIGFADIRHLFEWDAERVAYVPSVNLTTDQAAAIAAVEAKTVRFTDKDGNQTERIELKLKTWDKIRALRELGKHLGIEERVRHSGELVAKVRDMSDEELFERAAELTNRFANLEAVRSAPALLNGEPPTNGDGA